MVQKEVLEQILIQRCILDPHEPITSSPRPVKRQLLTSKKVPEIRQTSLLAAPFWQLNLFLHLNRLPYRFLSTLVLLCIATYPGIRATLLILLNFQMDLSPALN